MLPPGRRLGDLAALFKPNILRSQSIRKGEYPNVRNKHAYPVHRQNNAGGIGASTNAAGNYNPCPDSSACCREGPGGGLGPRPPGGGGGRVRVAMDRWGKVRWDHLEVRFRGLAIP